MPAEALIINSDDLGLWPSIDEGIFHAWSQGAVSDSSVFATADNLEEILVAAGEAKLPVGIHLNLTAGKPLSDPQKMSALVTADGNFMKRQLWPAHLPADQIQVELHRQVQRFYELGYKPSHLDSHHHIHNYPEIFAVVLELANEYDLPVRSVDERMRIQLRQAGIYTPDYFSAGFYGKNATIETLINLIDSCPGGVLEVMTHPGYDSDYLPSSYRGEREKELFFLTSSHWKSYLEDRHIPLIGYASLNGG